MLSIGRFILMRKNMSTGSNNTRMRLVAPFLVGLVLGSMGGHMLTEGSLLSADQLSTLTEERIKELSKKIAPLFSLIREVKQEASDGGTQSRN